MREQFEAKTGRRKHFQKAQKNPEETGIRLQETLPFGNLASFSTKQKQKQNRTKTLTLKRPEKHSSGKSGSQAQTSTDTIMNTIFHRHSPWSLSFLP
jgi:hypothetical protein